MKKIIVLVASVFALNQATAFCSSSCLQDKADDIRFDEMVKEDLDNLRSRSIGPAVSARVNYDMGQIEIAFNEYIGVAAIRVVDGMGMTIAAYQCDTETEWDAYLPIPVNEGAYTLIIDSSVAVFTGNFFIGR